MCVCECDGYCVIVRDRETVWNCVRVSEGEIEKKIEREIVIKKSIAVETSPRQSASPTDINTNSYIL